MSEQPGLFDLEPASSTTKLTPAQRRKREGVDRHGMTGVGQISRAAADAERDRALERVEENVDEAWKLEARELLERLAHERPELTSEDLWAAGLSSTRENRALGPVMLWAQRQGILAPTDRFVRTSIAKHHANPQRVWRSLVYREASSS